MLNAHSAPQTQIQTQVQLDTLTRLNVQDILENLGLDNLKRGQRALARLFWLPAKHFAKQLAHFDARISEIGLQDAANELLSKYIRHLDIRGAENIPARGGVIFAANHPGMTDTLACFSSIPRADLYTVSLDRPFVRALPHMAQRIFYVSEETGQRLATVRQIARHIQNGGAVLICPAGRIEPDPAVMQDASASLQEWSPSLGLFVQLAPESVIVPTVVSNVVYGFALHNAFTRTRKTPRERERAAASVQAFLQTGGLIKNRMVTRIEFGAPISARELRAHGDHAAITREITHAVEPLIRRASTQSMNT